MVFYRGCVRTRLWPAYGTKKAGFSQVFYTSEKSTEGFLRGPLKEKSACKIHLSVIMLNREKSVGRLPERLVQQALR